MYTEDELLPISALQHLAFCERQWGLIHLEGVWIENRLTAEGRRIHERVHEGPSDLRGTLRTARGLRLRSLSLGLSGVADVVEFRREDDSGAEPVASGLVPGLKGRWTARPVEYKRGRPKKEGCDTVQLCAQAMCLEEMLGANIREGYIFYARTHRRLDVRFTSGLRDETRGLADKLHELHQAGKTPPPPRDRQRCRRCSLAQVCLPSVSRTRSASRYLASIMGEGERT